MRPHHSRQPFLTVRVAREARRRIVDITCYFTVIVVRLGPRVARSRAGEDGKCSGILVAFEALEPPVFARIDREPGVVEIALVPGRIANVVAGLTGHRKAGGNVIGVVGLLVVVQMAVDTIRRQTLVGSA